MWSYQLIACGLELVAALVIGVVFRRPNRHDQLRVAAFLLVVVAVTFSVVGAFFTATSGEYNVTESVLVAAFAAFFVIATATWMGMLGILGSLDDLLGGRAGAVAAGVALATGCVLTLTPNGWLRAALCALIIASASNRSFLRGINRQQSVPPADESIP